MNDLIFYLAGCIFFLILSISKRKQRPGKARRILLLKRHFKKGIILLLRSDKFFSLQDEVNKIIGDPKVKKWPLR